MNVSRSDAEESLAEIQKVMQKTRHSIGGSGAYIFLIGTGAIWLIGFLANQFLSGPIVAYIWVVTSLLGSAVSIVVGSRQGRRVRWPSSAVYARRIGLFWLALIGYAVAVIAIARPADGRQLTMLIILFIMIGQMAMGLLLGFSSVWWSLLIAALALTGYFLLPGIFYLWMGILVGGSMIVLGLYIRLRW